MTPDEWYAWVAAAFELEEQRRWRARTEFWEAELVRLLDAEPTV